MRRREFLGALSCTAAWPFALEAQQATPTIGFLNSASLQPFAHLVAGFHRGLREAGYVEGQNVSVEYRWAEGQYDRVPALAVDLAQRKVALIAASGGENPALAAKAATTTIPVVFIIGGDPVKVGLVANLARPGGNATGVNIFTAELVEKRLGLLHELVPTASSIAVLVNPNFAPADDNSRQAETAARTLGKSIIVLKATSDDEIKAAFSAMVRARPGALLVAADPFFNSRRQVIVALAASQSIPAIYEWREYAEAGGLLSYGTNLVEAFRLQGVYAGRILKGEKPSDLPVIQLTKFELVINLRTAKAIGITFPPGLLAIADEVIE